MWRLSTSVRTEFFNPISNRFLSPSRIYYQPHEGSKGEMNRRGFALKGIVASGVSVMSSDLLGFGWIEKSIIEYDAMILRDQVIDFLKEIVKEPAVLVGNRLMTRFMLNQTEYTLDSFLSKLTCPLLLLWGDLDPWMGLPRPPKQRILSKHNSCKPKGRALST